MLVPRSTAATRQGFEIGRRLLLAQPLLERAVEALQLAERPRVRGTGVDQLDAEAGETTLELDREPEQTPGEAHVVVGKKLPRQAVVRACVQETAPRRLPGRTRTGTGGEEIAGVVIQTVDHPHGFAASQDHLSRVDLLQVIRKGTLEAAIGALTAWAAARRQGRCV